MLNLYNMSNLAPASKLIADDRWNGDGVTKSFELYYVNPQDIQRVYADGELKGTITDYYTHYLGTAAMLTFLIAPISGTANIIAQAGTCLYFPAGTTQTGTINACRGGSEAYPWYISNDDSDKGYQDVTITPLDFVGDDETSWVKLATTEAGLAAAVAGAALNIGDITDSDVGHIFWCQVTVPRNTLEPNTPQLNKYDLAAVISYLEYEL